MVFQLLLRQSNYFSMSSKSKISKKSSAGLAAIFFLVPFILFMMWVTLGWRHGYMSEVQKKDTFLSTFPEWMQNFSAIHILSIILCILAINFAAGSFKKNLLWIRIVMMIIVMFSILIILFDIVQLL